jgi:enediyne core biosynthesis thioesterase
MNLHSPGAAPTVTSPARYFRYRHRISFEETNLVGNVYFARHVAWQGRCREMFLLEYAPEIMAELAGDLCLVTLNVSCNYFAELRALDEIEIRMALAHVRQHRIGMAFDYVLHRASVETLAARGFQEIACMRETARGLVPCPIPAPLANALAGFQ